LIFGQTFGFKLTILLLKVKMLGFLVIQVNIFSFKVKNCRNFGSKMKISQNYQFQGKKLVDI